MHTEVLLLSHSRGSMSDSSCTKDQTVSFQTQSKKKISQCQITVNGDFLFLTAVNKRFLLVVSGDIEFLPVENI